MADQDNTEKSSGPSSNHTDDLAVDEAGPKFPLPIRGSSPRNESASKSSPSPRSTLEHQNNTNDVGHGSSTPPSGGISATSSEAPKHPPQANPDDESRVFYDGATGIRLIFTKEMHKLFVSDDPPTLPANALDSKTKVALWRWAYSHDHIFHATQVSNGAERSAVMERDRFSLMQALDLHSAGKDLQGQSFFRAAIMTQLDTQFLQLKKLEQNGWKSFHGERKTPRGKGERVTNPRWKKAFRYIMADDWNGSLTDPRIEPDQIPKYLTKCGTDGFSPEEWRTIHVAADGALTGQSPRAPSPETLRRVNNPNLSRAGQEVLTVDNDGPSREVSTEKGPKQRGLLEEEVDADSTKRASKRPQHTDEEVDAEEGENDRPRKRHMATKPNDNNKIGD